MRVFYCCVAGAALTLSACSDNTAPPDALALENLTADDLMVNEVVPAATNDVVDEGSQAPAVEAAETLPSNTRAKAKTATTPAASSAAKQTVQPTPAPEPEPQPEAAPDPHAGHDMNSMNKM